MQVSVVIENTSQCGMLVEHGLSLWIETCDLKFFFDLGQGNLFADNVKAMGIDVTTAEFVVISHGHYDHGGGIARFLQLNDHAAVYLHRNAFTECYSFKKGRARHIRLRKELQDNQRLLYTDSICEIASGLTLFARCEGRDYFSPANKRILKKVEEQFVEDDFLHEQSLIITEGDRRLLIAGCAHIGILNIMRKAESIIGESLTDVITGMHLTGVDDTVFIYNFARELARHSCHYYTCHCTGAEAYQRLKAILCNQIDYLSCGEQIMIE